MHCQLLVDPIQKHGQRMQGHLPWPTLYRTEQQPVLLLVLLRWQGERRTQHCWTPAVPSLMCCYAITTCSSCSSCALGGCNRSSRQMPPKGSLTMHARGLPGIAGTTTAESTYCPHTTTTSTNKDDLALSCIVACTTRPNSGGEVSAALRSSRPRTCSLRCTPATHAALRAPAPGPGARPAQLRAPMAGQ